MPQAADVLQTLLDKRNNALQECRRISDEASKSANGWTGEQRQEFDRWATEAKSSKETYDTTLADQRRGEWLTDEEAAQNRPAGRRVTNPDSHTGEGDDPSNPSGKAKRVVTWNPHAHQPRFARTHDRRIELTGPRAEEQYKAGFGKYLAGANPHTAFGSQYSPTVYSALRSDDEEQGGYLIASEQFMEGLLKAVDDATYIQSLARVVIAREARSLGWRKRTAKANSIRKGTELVDITGSFDTSLRYGKRTLTPAYFTGGIQVSRDFLRNSMMDGESIVRDELTLDMSEFNEQEFLYGDGNDGPLGVMVADAEGIPTSRDITVVAGDLTAGAVTSDYSFVTLQRAKFNLKLQYRNRARWMMHRDHVAYINNIRDTTGQFIFQASKQVGEPDRLLGLPFDESEWMPNTFTTGTYAGILAVWEHYIIAFGLQLEIQRLNEIAARTNQVEYHYRYTMDANVDLEEAFTRIKFG